MRVVLPKGAGFAILKGLDLVLHAQLPSTARCVAPWRIMKVTSFIARHQGEPNHICAGTAVTFPA